MDTSGTLAHSYHWKHHLPKKETAKHILPMPPPTPAPICLHDLTSRSSVRGTTVSFAVWLVSLSTHSFHGREYHVCLSPHSGRTPGCLHRAAVPRVSAAFALGVVLLPGSWLLSLLLPSVASGAIPLLGCQRKEQEWMSGFLSHQASHPQGA